MHKTRSVSNEFRDVYDFWCLLKRSCLDPLRPSHEFATYLYARLRFTYFCILSYYNNVPIRNDTNSFLSIGVLTMIISFISF